MYIPIKKSILANTELDRLKNDILEKYFAEHMLCLHFAINICQDIIDLLDNIEMELNKVAIAEFINKMEILGFDVKLQDNVTIFTQLLQIFENQWSKDNLIRRQISFTKS